MDAAKAAWHAASVEWAAAKHALADACNPAPERNATG
jgi:hypothetical protein